MKPTMKTLAVMALCALPAMPVLAQDERGDDNREVVERLMSLLDEAIPDYDESLLEVRGGEDWTEAISVPRLVEALNIETLKEDASRAPTGTAVLTNRAAALRIDPAAGRVGYVDRTLTPDLRRGSQGLPDGDRAFRIGLRALSRVGLPSEEFDRPEILTQMAAGGSIESREPEMVDEIFRLVVVDRRIEDFRVFGSSAVVAIAPTGDVQRLRTQWPAFRISEGDRLQERETVLRETAETLADMDVTGDAEITAQVGFAPVADEPGAPYIPIALVAVTHGETPVLLSAPLVSPGERDD